jgi:phosphoribosyl 1,2-cyclic phosphodiesterase
LSDLNTHSNCKAFDLSICVLASGSKGNATYISDGETSILMDAGLSGTEIARRMKSRSLDPAELDGIVVSHEHADHVQGVGVLSRRYKLPVFISRKTSGALSPQIGRFHDVFHFRSGDTFQLKSLMVHPFSISHDAQDPTGFTVQQNGLKIGLATDLGIATAMVREHLKNCTLLVVEANHDHSLLMEGPYPWYLKQRIKGRTGHLSNTDSRDLLEDVRHDRLTHVVLAHLSETNNTPEAVLKEILPAIEPCRARVTVATQHVCGDIIYI